MKLQYESYPFTPLLGWSISRYEVFDKCKRQYFYTYYSKYVPDVPRYKMTLLRDLTSMPLEIGNVVHDVIETFLRRLQQSDNDIDETRFFDYAGNTTTGYFAKKRFIEEYYGHGSVDPEKARDKVFACLKNFLGSPCYTWIFMKAIRSKENWMIEPEGYGETRLEGMKVYCKMDFLMPVDEEVHILDWKTGARDEAKHMTQLKGYAAAAASNFNIPWNRIFPKIVYLYPAYGELELLLDSGSYSAFIETIKNQTQEMLEYCTDRDENIPLPIDRFPLQASPAVCRQCRYQELCFPEIRNDRQKQSDRLE
ncbi:MAG: PD-(D/E)XK nuclease family protein [Chitinispirillaceae bacterium]|nr:PD-(D/E)XK nuclease family protein [Chitinispirillaceae bacterium]